MTDNSDLAEQYKNIKNAYLQGFIIVFALFVFSAYKVYKSNFEVSKIILSGIIGLVTLIVASILYKAQKNYKKYKKESELTD